MAVRINIPSQFNPDLLPVGKGIAIDGNTAIFTGDWSHESAAEYCAKFFSKCSPNGGYSTRQRSCNVKAIKATQSQIEKAVKRLDINPDDFEFYSAKAANTLPDRDGDQFTKALLEGFARFAVRESVAWLVDHNFSKTVGTIYDSEVLPMEGKSGHFELVHHFAIPKDVPSPNHAGMKMIDAINKRLYNKVSVGFLPPARPERVEIEANIFVNRFDLPPGMTEAENYETSFVAMGAQRGAELKSAFAPKNNPKINKSMEKSFSIGGKTLTVKAEGDNITASGLADIEKAFENSTAEIKALKAQAEEMQKQLDSTKAPFITNIENLQKKLEYPEALCDSEEVLKGYDLARLEALSKKLTDEFKAKNPGIDPSTGEKIEIKPKGKEIKQPENSYFI